MLLLFKKTTKIGQLHNEIDMQRKVNNFHKVKFSPVVSV